MRVSYFVILVVGFSLFFGANSGFAQVSSLITYEITGGEILDLQLNPEYGGLLIILDAKSDGSLTVTIPRVLLDATFSGGEDDTFFVLIDAEEVFYDEIATKADRTLTFEFPAGSEEIDIIGTFASNFETTRVSIPAGTSMPGCEETNECFFPYETTILVGSTVTWTNDDTAAHTVTGGTPENPTFEFDSSLFMAGNSFSYTFFEAGTFDYFCMVHPWMTGIVTVTAPTGQGGNNEPIIVPTKDFRAITLFIANPQIIGEDVLVVSGSVDPIHPIKSEKLELFVKTDDGKNQIAEKSWRFDDKNEFSINIPTGGPEWDLYEGNLIVTAEYVDYPKTTEKIFYEKGEEKSPQIIQRVIEPPDYTGVIVMVGVLVVVAAAIVVVMSKKKGKKKTITKSLRDSKLKE